MLLMLIFVTQVTIPVVLDKPIFPLLKKKERGPYEILAELQEWVNRAEAELEVADQFDSVAIKEKLRVTDTQLQEMMPRIKEAQRRQKQ